jgi:hypothetical protein
MSWREAGMDVKGYTAAKAKENLRSNRTVRTGLHIHVRVGAAYVDASQRVAGVGLGPRF